MKSLLGWLSELIPNQYKVSVILKKLAFLAGKLVAGYLAGKAAVHGSISLEEVAQINAGVAAAVATGLEILHDWAKVKWPDQKWL